MSEILSEILGFVLGEILLNIVFFPFYMGDFVLRLVGVNTDCAHSEDLPWWRKGISLVLGYAICIGLIYAIDQLFFV